MIRQGGGSAAGFSLPPEGPISSVRGLVRQGLGLGLRGEAEEIGEGVGLRVIAPAFGLVEAPPVKL